MNAETAPQESPRPPDNSHADHADADMVITARGVTHRFNAHGGVSDVDVEVPAGRIFGLVGPSGCGKTTMVRLVLGLLEPAEGDIRVLGSTPTQLSASDRRRIGYLPQVPALDPELSLRHNLHFIASLQGMPWRGRLARRRGGRAARERVAQMLALVDLDEHQKVPFAKASTGEQRRLALASAMVHDPDLLVLDEPTAGVDPILRQQLWEHLAQWRRAGRTVLVTTQYVTEADECDLVGLLVDGELVQVDSPDRLRHRAFGGDRLKVTFATDPSDATLAELLQLAPVRGIERHHQSHSLRLLVDDAEAATPEVTRWTEQQGMQVTAVAPHRASFDEVFIALVQEHRDRPSAGSSVDAASASVEEPRAGRPPLVVSSREDRHG